MLGSFSSSICATILASSSVSTRITPLSAPRTWIRLAFQPTADVHPTAFTMLAVSNNAAYTFRSIAERAVTRRSAAFLIIDTSAFATPSCPISAAPSPVSALTDSVNFATPCHCASLTAVSSSALAATSRRIAGAPSFNVAVTISVSSATPCTFACLTAFGACSLPTATCLNTASLSPVPPPSLSVRFATRRPSLTTICSYAFATTSGPVIGPSIYVPATTVVTPTSLPASLPGFGTSAIAATFYSVAAALSPVATTNSVLSATLRTAATFTGLGTSAFLAICCPIAAAPGPVATPTIPVLWATRHASASFSALDDSAIARTSCVAAASSPVAASTFPSTSVSTCFSELRGFAPSLQRIIGRERLHGINRHVFLEFARIINSGTVGKQRDDFGNERVKLTRPSTVVSFLSPTSFSVTTAFSIRSGISTPAKRTATRIGWSAGSAAHIPVAKLASRVHDSTTLPPACVSNAKHTSAVHNGSTFTTTCVPSAELAIPFLWSTGCSPALASAAACTTFGRRHTLCAATGISTGTTFRAVLVIE
ncbi:hypothetical protein AB1Y20_017980 [Prymnesium parvum]|uniref:Uncharacterized protein n=1 Tax=Prymnesium parvum TaxID=97485 RepID=A0AB34JPM2_PRYPA